jgi:hypothetical protein
LVVLVEQAAEVMVLLHHLLLEAMELLTLVVVQAAVQTQAMAVQADQA